MTDKTRINNKIRAREVRVISNTGEQLGIMSSRDAYDLAMSSGYDLVEISPSAKPPVCKIMDYGKYKYELARKAKEAKKNQKLTIVKEVKFKARIDKHDFETKIGKITKFLEKDNKVKVSLMMFGRERMYMDLGLKVLESVIERFKNDVDIEKKYGEKQKHILLIPRKK